MRKQKSSAISSLESLRYDIVVHRNMITALVAAIYPRPHDFRHPNPLVKLQRPNRVERRRNEEHGFFPRYRERHRIRLSVSGGISAILLSWRDGRAGKCGGPGAAPRAALGEGAPRARGPVGPRKRDPVLLGPWVTARPIWLGPGEIDECGPEPPSVSAFRIWEEPLSCWTSAKIG